MAGCPNIVVLLNRNEMLMIVITLFYLFCGLLSYYLFIQMRNFALAQQINTRLLG